jgi:hypothetical protein
MNRLSICSNKGSSWYPSPKIRYLRRVMINQYFRQIKCSLETSKRRLLMLFGRKKILEGIFSQGCIIKSHSICRESTVFAVLKVIAFIHKWTIIRIHRVMQPKNSINIQQRSCFNKQERAIVSNRGLSFFLTRLLLSIFLSPFNDCIYILFNKYNFFQ